MSIHDPIQQYEGVDIFVNPEGKFWAIVEGKRIEKASIGAVKKLIKTIVEPLAADVYKIEYYGGSIPNGRRVRILGKDHGQYVYHHLRDDGSLDPREYKHNPYAGSLPFYEIDGTFEPKMEEFRKRKEDLEEEVRVYMLSLKRWEEPEKEEAPNGDAQ